MRGATVQQSFGRRFASPPTQSSFLSTCLPLAPCFPSHCDSVPEASFTFKKMTASQTGRGGKRSPPPKKASASNSFVSINKTGRRSFPSRAVSWSRRSIEVEDTSSQRDGERCTLSVRSGTRKLLNGSGHMTAVMVQTTLTRVAEVSGFN